RPIIASTPARPRITPDRVTNRPSSAKHASMSFARAAGSRSPDARMYVCTAISTGVGIGEPYRGAANSLPQSRTPSRRYRASRRLALRSGAEMLIRTVGELCERIRRDPKRALGARSPRTLGAYLLGYATAVEHHRTAQLRSE